MSLNVGTRTASTRGSPTDSSEALKKTIVRYSSVYIRIVLRKPLENRRLNCGKIDKNVLGTENEAKPPEDRHKEQKKTKQ